ncbi:MAG: hypothetical protein ACRC0L_07955, partial [Angustibacter sp.]
MFPEPPVSDPPVDGLHLSWLGPMTVRANGTTISIEGTAGTWRFVGLTEPVIAAVAALDTAPTPLSALSERLGPRERQHFAAIVGRCEAAVRRTLVVRNRELLEVAVTGSAPSVQPHAVAPDDVVRLSKFALLRARAGRLVLESPLVKARMTIIHPGLPALVQQLAAAQTVRQLAAGRSGAAPGDPLSPDQRVAVVQLCCELGFVERAAAAAEFPEDRDPTLAQWEF